MRRIWVAGAAALVGALIGLGAGVFVGGNYAPGFEFAGQRGYEATGVVGAALGALSCAILASILLRERTR